MSGSPVAAAALTFLDAGVLDVISTFTMITGSRMGASFIVLFIGFIYVLRGRNKATSLDMGLLSLIVTATTHIPGTFSRRHYSTLPMVEQWHTNDIRRIAQWHF